MTRGPRRASPVTAAAALLAPPLLLLSGCGIPATGVVGAGLPATGVLPPAATDAPTEGPQPSAASRVLTLYFVLDGALLAMARDAPATSGIDTAVRSLLEGPDGEESGQGLTTELPPLLAAPAIQTEGATVTVEFLPSPTELSDTAVDQLVCTAAAAHRQRAWEQGPPRVIVVRPDGATVERSGDGCPAAGLADPTSPGDGWGVGGATW
ncbi:GerMN domain-containing protein [Allostreptomyces psammosilenae]|uniref:GerMN domain-containing protein n=1 Tax=Allostreptomyces psammosilenae TaxID=1892865 RepID=A0A852ZZU4_9ACTN|nr:GerMN domain-containing protein [Allostreptomyces psammosilenae]NYI07893.1 hypothetical protein [Allostreptomyces psammosilenae]